MSHAEAEELLGVHALDALEPGTADELEAHLAECATCRAELREHRAAAAAMAPAWLPPPPELWARIQAHIDAVAESPNVASIGSGRRRPNPWPLRVAGVAAAVAVALGIQVVRLDRQLDDSEEAVPEPAARTIRLTGEAGARMEVVLLTDGRGLVGDHNMPPLPPERTYQLWAVLDGMQVSLGVLGPAPGPAAFQVTADSDELEGLVVTNEAAPGSQQPSDTDVARADL